MAALKCSPTPSGSQNSSIQFLADAEFAKYTPDLFNSFGVGQDRQYRFSADAVVKIGQGQDPH